MIIVFNKKYIYIYIYIDIDITTKEPKKSCVI